MEIVAIFPPYIYSIQHDGRSENEFDRLFDEWNDVTHVVQFMEANSAYLNADIWHNIRQPEDAAAQVLDEAAQLEALFNVLYENASNGEKPDFDSHFHLFEGKYKYEVKMPPMKSYGTIHPSLLRIYAIKMAGNTYLITGGGIKLSDKIQNSPELKDHIIQEIDQTREFLKANGIMDSSDF